MRSGNWVMLAAAVLGACSSADAMAPSRSSAGPASGGAFAGNVAPSGGGSGGSAAVVPPEQEEDQSYRAPVVSGRWVWTANPDTGKIAVVDAKSFTVRLADAGLGPTFLTALPTAQDTSKALVINVGSHDATLLSAQATGAVTSVGPLPLQPDANAWTVSKTGKYAIAWMDSHALTPDPTQGYQDISVVDLRADPPVATRLSVGFLPSRIFIDDAERRAFVVASSGISVIDLGADPAPRVLREWPVSTDLREDVQTRDVSVLPDGSYALVRHEGSAVITLVSLADGTMSPVTLPGPVTDLDLVSDAQSALAVVRSAAAPLPAPDAGQAGASNGEAGAGGASGAPAEASGGDAGAANQLAPTLGSMLVILPIPGIFSEPSSFVSVSLAEVFGLVNIAPRGTTALLYSNAIASSHVTLLETGAGDSYLTHRTVDVRGTVHDVFPSPDGAYAIASLVAKDGGKPGFAAIPVSRVLPSRVQTTDAPVFAVAQSDGATPRAIVTVSDGVATFAAYVVRMPELVIDSVKLPSKPLPGATGLVPEAGMAYIAQAHPQGRITFINLESGVPRTITGFEIAAQVTDGN